MDSVSQKIARNFKPDDIHLFRVEEKKSKAFLRLISTGMKNPDKLKLPK